MGREIVYSEVRRGVFEPMRSPAARNQRRDTILGIAIIGGAFAVWVGALVIVAYV